MPDVDELVRAIVQAWQREQERADRLQREVDRLNGILQDKTVPALISASTTTSLLIEYLRQEQLKQDEQLQREQLQRQLEEEYRRRSEQTEDATPVKYRAKKIVDPLKDQQ